MTEWWSIDLLARDETNIEPFGRLSGGSLDWSVDRTIHGGGTLEVSQPPADVDWLSCRLRVQHHNGDQVTPMGVWLPVWPEWSIDGDLRKASIQVLDKTSLLSVEVPFMLQYGAGTVVTDCVAAILAQRGEQLVAITPSPLTLRTPMTWPAKTTWLRVVNDLLAAIGYGDLWADGEGWLRAEPYRAPDARPLVATYGGDRDDFRVLRRYTDTASLADIPNRVVAYSTGDATTLAMRGDAELPADHPLGYRRRGDIPRTYDGLQAASQDVIDAHAARLLAQAVQVTRRVSYTHPVDGVALRARVALRRLGVEGVVVERRVSLGVGPVVEDVARYIYTAGELLWI